MTPYVNLWGSHLQHSTPDKGIEQFPDYPRYSTGYTALFNTIGFMTETHMLKPYKQRVESTLEFMKALVMAAHQNKTELLKIRNEAKNKVKHQEEFAITWEVDAEKNKIIEFKGYESAYKKSEITGKDRLYYDQNKPFIKSIPYFDSFKDAITVTKPDYYVIPQSWHRVIHLLGINNIQYEVMTEDKEMEVSVTYIDGFETSKRAFEEHYYHYKTQLHEEQKKVHFRKGDILVPVNQDGNRYIIETLEPQAEDSFFKWNFFDMILQRKEYFSSYVFEDLAVDILKSDPELNQKFELRKSEDESFASNPRAQLDFIYSHSPHSEKEYMRYPIFKIMK